MFRRRRAAQRDWHMIDDSGRVGCPIRGNLDIDYCAGCDYLIDLANHDNVSYIICRPPQTDFGYEFPIAAGF